MVRWHSKKGSTIIIVLALISIFSMMGVMMLMSNSQTDKERSFLIDTNQLFYIAESGINHAFHKLKGHSMDTLWFSQEDSFEKEFGKNGAYKIDYSLDDTDGNMINIICTATLGKRQLIREAKAKLVMDRRITLNTPYLCKEEIKKLWTLKFLN